MHLLRLTLAVVTVLLATASPAAADPPEPTNFVSVVLESTPSLPDGYEVRVIGGDSFLELTVPTGHTAEVPDYGDVSATYLRFHADGTVERNDRSTAAQVNEARYGGSQADAATGGPRWVQVASGGTYAWHDHRIHWMSETLPPTDADGRVDLGGPDGTWAVDLVIDGTDTQVIGRLYLLDGPSPVPWFAAATLIAVVTVAGWARLARAGRADAAAAAVALLVTAAAALAVAAAERRFAPPGSAGQPVAVMVALGAGVAAAGQFARRARATLGLRAASASLLIGWAGFRTGVWSHRVLATGLPFWVDRGVTAVALGVGLGTALTLVLPKPRPAGSATPATLGTSERRGVADRAAPPGHPR